MKRTGTDSTFTTSEEIIYFDIIPKELNKVILFNVNDIRKLVNLYKLEIFNDIISDYTFWISKCSSDFPLLIDKYILKNFEKSNLSIVYIYSYNKMELAYNKTIKEIKDIKPNQFNSISNHSFENLFMPDNIKEKVISYILNFKLDYNLHPLQYVSVITDNKNYRLKIDMYPSTTYQYSITLIQLFNIIYWGNN